MQSDYEKLVQELEELASQEGDWDKQFEYIEATDAIRAWLNAGAQGQPPKVIAEYAHLVLGLQKQTTIIEPPPMQSPPSVEESEQEVDVSAELPAEEESAISTETSTIVEPVSSNGVTEQLDATVVLPSAEETDEPQTVIEAVDDIETPEQRGDKRNLILAKEYLERGLTSEPLALVQAVNVSKQLRGKESVAEEAEIVYVRARDALNEHLRTELDQGDAAKNNEDFVTARHHYNQALSFDRENAHARQALAAIESEVSADVTQHEIDALKRQLRMRRDLQQLEAAVYRAEAWDADDRLSPDLSLLLLEARQAFDEQRRAQGEQTTMMRFGDLQARREARDQIQDEVVAGKKTIFDVTTNQYRPAHQVLEEANRLYEERSEDTAQYELDRIERAKLTSPKWARDRLRNALAYQQIKDSETGEIKSEPVNPFFEQHRRLLEERQEEIERLVNTQDEAERLVEEADREPDPIKRLTLLLRAKAIFEYVTEIDSRINLARETATKDLAEAMRLHHEQAQLLLSQEKYEAARQELNQARAIPNRWPETEELSTGTAKIVIPADLEASLQIGEAIRKIVNAQEALFLDYSRHAVAIRERVRDADKRKLAIRRFDIQVAPNEAYHQFNDYQDLEEELIGYRDSDDILLSAQQARSAREWEKVKRLANEVLENPSTSSQLRQEVTVLYDEAILELALERIRELLKRAQVADAAETLDKLLNAEEPEQTLAFDRYRDQLGDKSAVEDEVRQHLLNDPAYENTLHRRLADQMAAIEQARANTLALQPLYDRAVSVKDTAQEKERMEALRILRYIGGDRKEKPSNGWPPYQVTFLTAPAFRRATELRKALRDLLLPSIVDSAQRIDGIGDVQLGRIADRARAMRETRLLDDEEERAAARTLIVGQGIRDAKEKEENHNWDGAVEVWHGLYEHYPREVSDQYRHARIHQALARIDHQLQMSDDALAVYRAGLADEERHELQYPWQLAMQTLRNAQNSNDLEFAWQLTLKSADIYAAKGDFSAAYNSINLAAKQKADIASITEKRTFIQREEKIYRALTDAEAKRSGDPADALKLLTEALRDPDLENGPRLLARRTAIFNAAAQPLRVEINAKKSSQQLAHKIDVVVKAVDLRTLEANAEIVVDKREAEKFLAPLRAELTPSAHKVIEAAEQFTPNQAVPAYTLQEALDKASELDARLTTFSQTIIAELGDTDTSQLKRDLERSQEDITQSLSRLKSLEQLMALVRLPNHDVGNNESDEWTKAVVSGNFDGLNGAQDNITALGLNHIRDVRQFNEQLDEWYALYMYLDATIVDVRRSFQSTESFDEIVDTLNRLEVRPDEIPSVSPNPGIRTSKMYRIKRINDDMYMYIRNLMSYRLNVQGYRGKLTGWAEVKRGSAEREHEYRLWHDWLNAVADDLRELELAWKVPQTHSESMSVLDRRADWQKIADLAQQILDALAESPQEDEQPLPIRSRKAKELDDRAESVRQGVQSYLDQALFQLSNEPPPFPSAREFAAVAPTIGPLRDLIDKADMIGPGDDAEKARLKHYKAHLEKNIAKKNRKGLFDRLFDR